MCGGTHFRFYSGIGQTGLSPRVRGNRHRPCWQGAYLGSIPACAGEPIYLVTSIIINKVYPRVCGGTVMVVKL